MKPYLSFYSWLCDRTIWCCLGLAVATDDHRQWVVKTHKRLAGALRELLRRFERPRWRAHRGNVAWNRTPEATEQEIRGCTWSIRSSAPGNCAGSPSAC